jgi:hypothetical protein
MDTATAVLLANNPRSRTNIMEVMRRQRQRSQMKWKAIVMFLINVYFWWKGGGATVIDTKTGNRVDIADPSLPMDVRLQAMAVQATANSNDSRLYFLLTSIVEWVFVMLYDSLEVELFQGELYRALDYQNAPSPDQLAAWNTQYQQMFSQAASQVSPFGAPKIAPAAPAGVNSIRTSAGPAGGL